MRTVIILAATGMVLAGCGTPAPLAPVKGARLPDAPYGADQQPTAQELLRRDALAAPERSVELRRRSEERQDDPFDLPPE